MLARTGALAMDYFYLMELPADLNSEQLSEISTDLEYRYEILSTCVYMT